MGKGLRGRNAGCGLCTNCSGVTLDDFEQVSDLIPSGFSVSLRMGWSGSLQVGTFL